jgi:hypothetical protein
MAYSARVDADLGLCVRIRFLVTIITNQNFIEEEVKRTLNSSDACLNSVQMNLSSRLLYKNVKEI